MKDARRLLREFGIQPKKSLGQNFLVDQRALERIVKVAELGPEDIVLEIGPGLGTLTRYLAEKAGKVVAVELDPHLVEALRQILADYPNVEIVAGDILQLDPAELIGDLRRPCDLATLAPYKVVANLPYYITSAVLRHLLAAKVRPKLMVVTVQLEVARRITAGPGEMSLLAVSVQFYGRPRIVARIKAGAFYPSPQVDSAVVRIDLYDRPPVEVEDVDSFFEVVRAGFAHRRKQLRNTLSAELALLPSQVEQALSRAGINPRRRAQTLSLEEWARVWRELGFAIVSEG
jgi:16S rRNA (adenine1518-N6/adenine1519-N6)-dimethyltransferase